MPRRKKSEVTTPAPAAAKPETVPLLWDQHDLASDPDFLIRLERRRELAEQRAELSARLRETDNEFKNLGLDLDMALSGHGLKAVDLGDGTVMERASGPGPIRGEMIEGMIQELMRAGVDVGLLKRVAEGVDREREKGRWYTVRFKEAERG